MLPKSSQLGAGGGKGEGPFHIFFVPGAPLGANMVPRPVPRGSWGCLGTVLGPFWTHFGSILHAFSGTFMTLYTLPKHGGGGRRQALGYCLMTYLSL